MLLVLEVESDLPIYQQIRDQVVVGIANGQLMPGDSLPSIRQLASDFGINLHTVNKAYDLLEREGFIQLKRKTGAVVQLQYTLSANWETRLHTLLAEAYAQHIPFETILASSQRILSGFAEQRKINSPFIDLTEGTK